MICGDLPTIPSLRDFAKDSIVAIEKLKESRLVASLILQNLLAILHFIFHLGFLWIASGVALAMTRYKERHCEKIRNDFRGVRCVATHPHLQIHFFKSQDSAELLESLKDSTESHCDSVFSNNIYIMDCFGFASQ